MGALIQGLVLSDRRLIDFPLPSSRSRSNRYPDPDYEVLMGFDDEMREGRGESNRRRRRLPDSNFHIPQSFHVN